MKNSKVYVKAYINFAVSIDKVNFEVYHLCVKPVRYHGKACIS